MRGAVLVLALMSISLPGPAGAKEGRKNRLASESSPYLLQHQLNPVDWYPWGDEAFEAARRSDRPIFLSIGYSTCHWCHVMERESFENEDIAALMNRDFVSIKVDREERPDLDDVYMTACQLMTQSGGWPLTVILTPEGKPFFAGTYFPPEDRYGRIGMRTLLPRLAEVWKTQRQEVERQAASLTDAVRRALASPPGRGSAASALDRAFGDDLLEELKERFDSIHGGFSDAPKFPPHPALRYLLFRARQGRNPDVDRMLRRTLDAMQDGGVFDQVGGGFHRYSVDGEWFVPHFEKMLYDNAQLLEIYAGAARIYGDERYRETADRTADWLEREMRTPEGGFASALDADSEGVEGKYYLWTSEELERVLGTESFAIYRAAFDIRKEGNAPPHFEEGRGRNLPRFAAPRAELARRERLTEPELSAALLRDQTKLEAVRSRRVPPARDDKVITAWNALAVSALARASRDLAEPRLLAAARRAADCLLRIHVRGNEVLHVSRHGSAKIEGFLEDYALLARSLLDLAEVTGDTADEAKARELAGQMVRKFRGEGGGFYQTAAHGPRGLLDSSREFLDQVLPSPNAVAAEVLRRLDAIEPDAAFSRAAEETLRAAAPYARAFPTAAAGFAILSAGEAPAAASLPSTRREGPVTLSAAIAQARLAPGSSSTLTVRIVMDAGWHIPDHEGGAGGRSATSVTVFPSAGLSADTPAYPPGARIRAAGEEISAYSGALAIPVRIHASPDAADGEASVRLKVEFQPCDDSRCLAPRRVELAVPLKIARRE